MGVTIGEVEAVLTARDAMSAVLESARANVAKLDESIKTLKGTQDSFSLDKLHAESGISAKNLGDLKGEADGVSTAAAGMGSVIARVASAAALGAFIKSSVEAGAHAAALAEQLRVDAHWLQQVGAAAKMGEGDINDATSSITYMQRAIAGGDAGVVQALKDMHLDLNTLRGMNVQGMFMTITEAAQGMPDPIKQTDAVMTLLGRNAGVYLPAIRQGFKGVTEQAIAMSSESSEALDRILNKMGQIATGAKVLAGETIGQLALVFEQLTGTGAFDIDAVLAKIQAAPKATRAAAEMTEESLARIRRAGADLEVVFASAAKDGFQAQRAAAEKLHEMQLADIEATVQSDEEKHVRLIEEAKRYSADLFMIKTDEARTLRGIQEQSAAAIIARQETLLDAQLALELSKAAISRDSAESIAAQKAAIISRYAGEEYNAKMAALTALEHADALQADREFDNAEKKAAALLAIHEDYEQRRLILATQSQAALNTQVEALEAAHLARMAKLGLTSSAQSAPSLDPRQAAAEAQHRAALGPMEAAQKQALALGDIEGAQRLQRLIEEEGAAFVRALQEGGEAVQEFVPKVDTSVDGFTAAIDRATGAIDPLRQQFLSMAAAGQLASGYSIDWGSSTNSFKLPTYGSHLPGRASGGPVDAGMPYIVGEKEPEVFVPSTDGTIVPSLRGGGGGGDVTVHVHNNGLLMSSDPRAQQQLAATISEVVSRSIKANRKLGTN